MFCSDSCPVTYTRTRHRLSDLITAKPPTSQNPRPSLRFTRAGQLTVALSGANENETSFRCARGI